MKLLIAIFCTFLSLSTFACSDFSGQYEDLNMGSIFTIIQDKCTFIDVKTTSDLPWEFSTILDGAMREITGTEGIKRHVGASFSENGKVLKIAFVMTLEGSNQSSHLNFLCQKENNGDIAIEMIVTDELGNNSSMPVKFRKL